jgi:hypothetical protein
MKVKIFHSMPLRGKTEEEIQAARAWQHPAAIAAAAEWFHCPESDCEIMPTLIEEQPGKPYKTVPLWYFGRGVMEHLSQADFLALAPDWGTARGCRAEMAVATEYDLPMYVLRRTK